ncbi:MAG TPA: polyphosphate kinase 1 [Opitutaceae bacterium]
MPSFPFATKKKSALSLPAKGKLPYFNRELSWLAFDRRVLDIARSDRTPLLERLKFLSIVSSNLDEFFEIRVAGLIQQVDSDLHETTLDGLSPHEQLRRIHSVVASLVDDQYRCWKTEVVPQLRTVGIHFKSGAELTSRELTWARRYFDAEVFPLLTPLSIDPSHPFPHIGNKTLNIVVAVDYPDTPEVEAMLAIIPVPRALPRVVRIAEHDGDEEVLIFIGEIIKLFVERLFPECHVTDARVFRVTRNSDLYIDEEEAENLLKKIEAELRNLRRGAAVRLEIEEGVDERIFKALLDHLNLANEYVFRIDGPINLMRLMQVYDAIDRPDLKFQPYQSRALPESSNGQSIFERIHRNDILLLHPYESFDPVVDFVNQAARDPKVHAIKQTLYRTSGDSPIVRALIEASQSGKQVTALIELKARFDEANNIQWARRMEEAGVHVVYGIVGLKIHAKCSLIVRRETGGLRHYAHVGTGNYNPKTARLYTDFSLFTTRRDITREIAYLFNTITGFGRPYPFRRLLVAPFNLQSGLIARIAKEIAHAQVGHPARIIVQINSLIDKTLINSFYAASCAGVKIDLVVRGICGLVPGVKGISENIRVRSLVGRFLEHARVYYFENGGKPRIYLGSSDLMPRNLYRRVELLVPIDDTRLRQKIIDAYLPQLFADNIDARVLQSNGAYRPVRRSPSAPTRKAQDTFLTNGF